MKQILSLIFIFIICAFTFSACSLNNGSNNEIQTNVSTITIKINSETKLNFDISTYIIVEDINHNSGSQIFTLSNFENNNSTNTTIILNCKNKNFTIPTNTGNIKLYIYLYCILNNTMVDLGKTLNLYTKTKDNITKCYEDQSCKTEFIGNVDYNVNNSPGNKKLNAKFTYTLELK